MGHPSGVANALAALGAREAAARAAALEQSEDDQEGGDDTKKDKRKFPRGSSRCKRFHPFTDRGSINGSAAPKPKKKDGSIDPYGFFGIGVKGIENNFTGVGKVDGAPGLDAKIEFGKLPWFAGSGHGNPVWGDD